MPGENTSAIWELNSYGIGAGNSTDGIVDPYTGLIGGLAVLFEHGHVVSLGTLPGGQVSFAQDINDQGQVAGFSSNGILDPYSYFGWGTETRTFVWRNGVMHDIGDLGGPDTEQAVQNQQGEIAGQSDTNDTPSPYTGVPTQDPYLWEDGHMTDLGTLGGDYGNVNWMNDAGEVVGYSFLANDTSFHPFLWNGRRMIDLGTLGGAWGSANWISDNGDIAGAAQLSDRTWNGALWHDGKMIDLPPVDGAPDAFANSVNDEGEVVGNTTDANFNELDAVLWTGGSAYDLNALVAPSQEHLTAAQYINDQGDIVSNAVLPNGDQRLVLLVPNYGVPLPGASTTVSPLPATGVQDRSSTALFALHAARYGVRAAVHQLMLSRGRFMRLYLSTKRGEVPFAVTRGE